MEERKKTIFDAITAINDKIPTYEYDKKTASAYMLMLWMSLYGDCGPQIDRLNERLFEMPDKLVFSALYKGIPRGKRFSRWPTKSEKEKGLTEKKKKLIKELMDVHGFSSFEAETIFKRYIDIK